MQSLVLPCSISAVCPKNTLRRLRMGILAGCKRFSKRWGCDRSSRLRFKSTDFIMRWFTAQGTALLSSSNGYDTSLYWCAERTSCMCLSPLFNGCKASSLSFSPPIPDLAWFDGLISRAGESPSIGFDDQFLMISFWCSMGLLTAAIAQNLAISSSQI